MSVEWQSQCFLDEILKTRFVPWSVGLDEVAKKKEITFKIQRISDVSQLFALFIE